jgi:DNA repair protein RecO (recombination protein O)
MSVLTSEAVVLRTWPVHEADLIVCFLTRDFGKVRGVAKSALKSRKRFGGALEPMTVARAFFAEVLDEALPEHDPQETVFRLLLAVLDQTTVEQPWMPLTFFSLWMTRLMGLLPDIAHCTVCREALVAGQTSFNTLGDGLFCPAHRNGNASELSADSWQLALRMLKSPASAFTTEPWPRRRAQDLRRFTLQALERHLERKLRSAEALARLGG